LKLFFLFRSLIGAVAFAIWTLLCSVAMILSVSIHPQRRRENIIIKKWAQFGLFFFGLKVQVEGLENKPNKGCIYLFNHTSLLDILIIHSIISNIRFGSKIEVFSVPMMGLAMKKAGVLPIARHNAKEVIQVYENTKPRLEQGEQFVLSPEGKRNTDSNLASFKAGPFLFAIQTKAPLVPIVIDNANQALPKGSLLPNTNRWIHKINMKILPAVETKDFTDSDKQKVMDQIFETMSKKLNSLNMNR